MSDKLKIIEKIRSESRALVRELGFMGGDFAGTPLSPSAVHALIEIQAAPRITARELSHILRLEKSSISRALRKLIQAGVITEIPSENDNRFKKLFLTDTGNEQVNKIHLFARSQVANALTQLKSGEDKIVLKGLRLYANALFSVSDNRKNSFPIKITEGYLPGIIARIIDMYVAYYSKIFCLDQSFESHLAVELSEFCLRLNKPQNRIWSAVCEDQIVGSIAVDGEGLEEGKASLLWFIVDENLRETGIGRKLLSAALAFLDETNTAETHLGAFDEFIPAIHLFKSSGFVLTEEKRESEWGREVLRQRYTRKHPHL